LTRLILRIIGKAKTYSPDFLLCPFPQG